MFRNIFMILCGGSFGLIAAGGVFTVFISVGLIPRFEGKTHTGADYTIYETMVCLGAIGGCIVSVFHGYCELGNFISRHHILPDQTWLIIAKVLLILFGLFAGMFEGCFAIAIAEMLNTIPIFARRVGFRHGLGIAILMIALGKLAGSLFYFSQRIFLYGGL
ncbi:MAG: stage V sporulation protein AB [Lachnospiraceae bacterium]|nr:stage V sporulation protein AB [Lachnospiraceae bacterium]